MDIYPDTDLLNAALIREIETEGLVEEKKVRSLLQSGADPNKTPALFMAVSCELDLSMVRLLLDYGAHPCQEGNSAMDTIILASALGRTGTVRLLLEHGADPNYKGNEGESALAEAAERGDIDTARLLLDFGADIELTGGAGMFYTPLKAAAAGGHVETVRLLLERGADVNSDGADYSAVWDQMHRQASWLPTLTSAEMDRRKQVLTLLAAAGAKSTYRQGD